LLPSASSSLGGYRNDITYGNLEDLSLLVNALAVRQDTDQPGAPEPPPASVSPRRS
jgi:hypothetical protein